MPFKSKLRMEHIEKTEKYKLFINLIYITWKKKKWIIPKGYASDGHSIPRLLRSIGGSPFATTYPKSAWYHDFLCEKFVNKKKMSRNEADSEYSHAMKDEGAPVWKRKRNWLGVRIGSIFRFGR